MTSDPRVAGIVLAAGASSRMGRPKALLPIASDTFVTRVVRTLAAAGVSPVAVIVAGADAAAVREALTRAGLAAIVVENPNRDRGQLSSLLVGLDAIDTPGIAAALVLPVDCPLVRIDTVRQIVDAFRAAGAPIIRPAAGGRHGHPVLFAREVFDDLRRADSAVGARAVVRAHAAAVVDVPVDDPGAFIDIDTPDDYARLVANRPS